MVVVIVIVVVVVDGRMVVTRGIDVSSSSILGGFWYDIILVSVFIVVFVCVFGCVYGCGVRVFFFAVNSNDFPINSKF